MTIETHAQHPRHHTFLENCPFCNAVALDKSSGMHGVFIESIRCSSDKCPASFSSTDVKTWNTRYAPANPAIQDPAAKAVVEIPHFTIAWNRVVKSQQALRNAALCDVSPALERLNAAVTHCDGIVQKCTANLAESLG